MIKIFQKTYYVVLVIFALQSCGVSKIDSAFNQNLQSTFYDNHFTGILIYDPSTKDTVFGYNAKKYFTPASNTKIFTLYSALKLLPQKVPAFKYNIQLDTITLLGTGNPTFLHPFFNDSVALRMAKDYKYVRLVDLPIEDENFGPGWAWEDYDTYFSPERSSFPMYGNIVTISKNDSIQSIPKFFKNKIEETSLESYKRRALTNNIFYYNAKRNDTIETPFIIDEKLIKQLWQNILKSNVSISEVIPSTDYRVAYSIPSDTLYKRMMEVSDNFLAEQMLIMASSTMSDTLSSKKVRQYILEHQLSDLKQKPRWVDGSGLSRYNLFTPASFVHVLYKMYNEVPQNRLFNLFPVGGKTGTLKRYYKGNPEPYIYAKSGTLSNNYALSGYLITNSGKTLIFSFMNNHYKKSTTQIKQRMEMYFEWLRDNY